MKIKKVDEKPMVIHQKKEPKLHLHTGKKKVRHKKADNTVEISGRAERNAGGKRDKISGKSRERGWKESADSHIKVKNRQLKAFASAGARYGMKQIDGGEEVAESAGVMEAVSVPAVDLSDRAVTFYRKKKAEKKGRKQKLQTESEYASDYVHARQKTVRSSKSGKKDADKRSGRKKGGSANASFVKSRMIESFFDKLQTEKEDGQGGMIEGVTKTAKAAALLLAKQAAAFLSPVFLMLFAVIGIIGIIVVSVLAVIYNSPLSIFFPQPDTGYDSPRTVLCEYYKEFNRKIITLENGGNLITYQNSDGGAPVSNFNDTLMVYMVKYGTGRTGFVMDREGKANLKKVFEEMNYMDSASSAVEKQVGDSIGEVMVTAYCPCSQCCGPYANGITASGKTAKPKHTIAVDAYHPIVPMGTKVVIEGVEYTVEDTGNLNHYNNDFDIFYATHSETSQWGRRKVEAFLAEGNTNTVMVTVSGTVVHNLTYEDYIALGKLDNDQTKLLRDMMNEDLWASGYIGAGGQAVAELAMTKIGCGYSQDRRYEEGWYDCSSLVQRLYKETGINLPATAAAQGEYCYKNAMLVNKKDLKPGDLIFYSYKDNGEFRNISHVAVYVGNGKMVHAANPERGVVMDNLRTNKVVFYARPY